VPTDPRMPPQVIVPPVFGRRGALASVATVALAALVASTRQAQPRQPGVLRLGGTGMALATMQQIGQAFVATRPELRVNVLPSLGTAGGLAAVSEGAIDLSLSARTLNAAEDARGLRSLAYARTPVAFVTHLALGVTGVTLPEVARILAGGIPAWPDGTLIRLVRREPSDADWTMLRSLSPDMSAAVTTALGRPGLLTVATDQENADILERLPGSFGMMSIGQLRAEARGVMPLTLDGVAPDVGELAAGRYRLSRTLHAVWREPPMPDVATFLAFLRGAQVSELLSRLGHIPLAGDLV
jgi:phosphate transport system substrate-binding protein